MFMGPLQVSKPWSTNGLVGVHRFLDRVWRISERPLSDEAPPRELVRLLHKTIKKAAQDTANLEFNTAISQMMIFINELYKQETLFRRLWEPFVLILSPYAPHLGEELWEKLGKTSSVSTAAYPGWDETLTRDEVVTVVFQVNGKVRSKAELPADTTEEDMKKAAMASERIRSHIHGKTVEKIVTVPGKLVNIVVS